MAFNGVANAHPSQQHALLSGLVWSNTILIVKLETSHTVILPAMASVHWSGPHFEAH